LKITVLNKKMALAIGAGAFLIVMGSIFGIRFIWHKLYVPDFESVGLQVGQRVPNLTVTAEDGKQRLLLSLLDKRFLLVVSGSLTCPVSRVEVPKTEALAKEFLGDITTVILYTTEAHPSAGASLYSRGNKQPEKNQREGIAREQPRNLLERDKLADEFKERLGLSLPIMLDNMENHAWASFGGGPNMAILIDRGGIVRARQGWFDDDELRDSIKEALVN
jgi:Iodothyronine deiodinase